MSLNLNAIVLQGQLITEHVFYYEYIIEPSPLPRKQPADCSQFLVCTVSDPSACHIYNQIIIVYAMFLLKGTVTSAILLHNTL